MSEQSPPSHLIFVVHGMGYSYGGDSKDSAFAKNLQDLRQTCTSTLAAEFNDNSTSIEFIPISWHRKLHSLSTVERIKSITLPTCSMMRNVANDLLADVLYYFTAFHGQQILNICCELLNSEYLALMVRYPDFNGKVSIFAHSLGSIICYDLLANQNSMAHTPPKFPVRESHGKVVYPKLKFTPNNLFMVGSPLGAVIIQRGQEFTEYLLPETKVYNLFNLYDPLAYRLEPLLDSRFTDISPVLCQRPRVDTTFELGYYKEMVYAYLPDLSALPTMPSFSTSMPSFSTSMPSFSSSMPSFSTSMPTMPTFSSVSTAMPSIPNIPIPSIPAMPSLSFEKLFPFLSSGPLPMNLPSNTLLESAQKLLTSQINRIFSPVLGKRKLEEEDDDGHVGKKREGDDQKSIPVTLDHHDTHNDVHPERIIKPARSKIHKTKSTKSNTKVESNSKEGNNLTSHISQIFSTPTPLESNLLNLSSELTSRLVSAASQAERDMNQVEIERIDYFVQDKLVSVARQYYLGMSAHFSYW